ncbi:TOMM precursor leader peptide-binding protein [Streptomyces sp. KR80]|uniref:TOMM precursor leader peptide-binding protein n=1 Tax=Streptomyces sp. KR80 TaxID=3457426 RepID=UPI003FD02526
MFLRGAGGDFFLKGRSAYRWLTALAPRLAAGCALDELLSGLREPQRSTAEHLLGRLVDSGFVRERRPEPSGLLSDAERSRFAQQISFLAHYSDRPQACFRQVREARVLVVGGGVAARAAAVALLRNGVRRLALSEPSSAVRGAGDGLEREVRELSEAGVPPQLDRLRPVGDELLVPAIEQWSPDAVVITPQGASLPLLDEISDHARKGQRVFLAARQFGGVLIKGPLVPPGDGPCWTCLQLQLAEFGPPEAAAAAWREKLSGGLSDATSQLHTAVAAATGSELATELFKHLSGCIGTDLAAGVVVQQPLSLESRREPLAAHPACPGCSRSDEAEDPGELLRALAGGDRDLAGDIAARSARYEGAMAETVGPLRGFGDSAVPQTLVKIGRVRCNGTPGGAVLGYHAESVTRARADAVERAVRRAAAVAPLSRPARRCTRKELADQGESVLSAEQFTLLAPGARIPDDQESVPWVPALSLHHHTVVWIPADLLAAAAPGPAVAGGVAGHGVGATFAEVATRGLVSALLHDRLRGWLTGAVPARVLEPFAAQAGGGSGSPAELGLPFLPALRRLSGGLYVAELPGDTPVHVVAAGATAPATGTPLQVAAAGLSRGDAVCTALVELSGCLQHPLPSEWAESSRALVCPSGWPSMRPEPDLASESEPDRDHDPGPLESSSSGPRSSRSSRSAAESLDDLLASLRTTGRDALLVDTTPSTPGTTPLALTGRVLVIS